MAEAIARLNQTRRDEKNYSKILCSFMRSLDEHQKKQEMKERQERDLSESELIRIQVEEEVLAGVGGVGGAHELADSVQEQEISANESYLVRKIESDARAKERYRMAMASLNDEKRKRLKKNHSEITKPPLRVCQESTFNSIERAIENKMKHKRDLTSNVKAHENDCVKKYTLSYINVYSATNKYQVKKDSQDRGVKAVDSALLKNAETEQKEAEFALRREEQLERARLRGKHADHVNRMEKDRKTIMKELSFYQKKDLQQKRRKLDATKPLNAPFPERKAIERRKQRELETQFEKLFIPDQEPRDCREPSEEKAFIGQTKLRDLISQQRELCSELKESLVDDNMMTSQNETTPNMSVFALSESDITM